MKRISIFIFLFLTAVQLCAQRVDTVAVYTPSMGVTIKNVVILPASYGRDPARRYSVVYLLHGYNGRYDTWINKTKSDLAQVLSSYDMIAVCPDGRDSWYIDSPIDPSMRFDTYISRELVRYIDLNYRTIASPAGRAVTGFSMGGHGGLWLGFTHPDIFGACGSMAGGVDLRPFPERWGLKGLLGEYATNTRRWDDYSVINQVYRLSPGRPAIIIDCGTGDFFFQVNEALHRKLLYNNIPHEYITRPGRHEHAYWANALDAQLLFFSKFFRKRVADKVD